MDPTVTKARYNILSTLCSGIRKVESYTQGCGVGVVEWESESEGILDGFGVGKNVPNPTPTSI
jgi:hypothetical protein